MLKLFHMFGPALVPPQDRARLLVPAFCHACGAGSVTIVKFLVSVFKLSRAEAMVEDAMAFRDACALGRLEVCEYLHDTFSLSIQEVRLRENAALRLACAYG